MQDQGKALGGGDGDGGGRGRGVRRRDRPYYLGGAGADEGGGSGGDGEGKDQPYCSGGAAIAVAEEGGDGAQGREGEAEAGRDGRREEDLMMGHVLVRSIPYTRPAPLGRHARVCLNSQLRKGFVLCIFSKVLCIFSKV